jgi:AraC-like DNA-binding protein
MALFFDRLWFDAKLNGLGLTRAAMATHAGLTDDELTLIFKDQMEVSPSQVTAWAHVLGEAPSEIAKRCGVSTPVLARQSDAERIGALEERVAQLEAQIRDFIKPPNAKSQ